MRKIIIITSLFILIGISSCNKETNTIDQMQNNENIKEDQIHLHETNTESSNIDEEKTISPDNLSEIMNTIPDILKTDPSFNESIKSYLTSEIYSNLSRKAIDTDRVELCEKLNESSKQKLCKNSFYLTKALKTKDKELCKKLDDSNKSKCLKSIINTLAKENGEKEICDQLQNEDNKLKCKDNVILREALEENNIKKCDFIQDAFDKKLCKDSFIDNNIE